MAMNLIRLVGDYYYHVSGCALYVKDPHGDTILSPIPGRWQWLETATSKTDALKKARAWRRQS